MRTAEIEPIFKNAHPADSSTGNAGGTGLLLYQRKYGVPQAAELLNIGETKMRDLIRNGMIPVLDLDGKILILERDLEDYLKGRQKPLRKVERKSDKLPPLPKDVRESSLLKTSN